MPNHTYTLVSVFVVLTCLVSLANITSVHEQCPYTKLTMSVTGSLELPKEEDTEKRMRTLTEKKNAYITRKSYPKLRVKNVTRHDILCPNAVKRDVGKTRCKSDVIYATALCCAICTSLSVNC